MTLQALPKRLAGVDAAVAVLARHLHDEAERRFSLRLGPHGVMDLQEPAPVDVAFGPFADAIKVAGAKTEFAGAPAEKIDVLRRPQVEKRSVDLGDAEDDDAPLGFFDDAAE